jgi:hypothetical protein
MTEQNKGQKQGQGRQSQGLNRPSNWDDMTPQDRAQWERDEAARNTQANDPQSDQRPKFEQTVNPSGQPLSGESGQTRQSGKQADQGDTGQRQQQ